VSLVSLALTVPSLGFAQDTGFFPNLAHCDSAQAKLAKQPDFKQRACYYATRVLAPGGLVRSAFSASWSDWRNSPWSRDHGFDNFGDRLAAFYARRSAQNAGEFIAGYLHHESLTAAPSGKNGFWNRTLYAFRSVLVTPDGESGERFALAPMAGALGSGMTSIAVYQHRNDLADGFRRSGLNYGGYFGTAFLREFRPDLTRVANHLLRRDKFDEFKP
jgi:hypothetical protein